LGSSNTAERSSRSNPRLASTLALFAGSHWHCRLIATVSIYSNIYSDSSAGDKIYQFPMHELVAGDDVAGLHGALVAGEIGDEAAGLAHQQHARREIPRRKPALPVGVEAAGRHIGETERGGADAPQARDLVLDRPH